MKELTTLKTASGVLRAALSLLAMGCLTVVSAHATDDFWTNSVTIDLPPQIDASNFVNSGVIQIATELPFETQNTVNYTNSGTMIGSVGWFFDTAREDGSREFADNFVNLSTGTVQALDGGGGFSFIVGGPILGGNLVSPSYLWVSATNIVNKGTLGVGADGYMKLEGSNINLARSALDVASILGNGSGNGITNFVPDIAIYDEWWGTTNGTTFISSGIWDGTTATTPPHTVQIGPTPNTTFEVFSVTDPLVFGYTNASGFIPIVLTNIDGSTTNILLATNITRQAVFVGLTDPSLSADVTFTPSLIPTNAFQSVAVHLWMTSTNVITQLPETSDLYFYDDLASSTNRGLLLNPLAGGYPPIGYYRPANYVLSRVDNGFFAAGRPGNATPGPSFLFDPLIFTNPIVVGDYAGYAAFVDYLAQRTPTVGSGYATNLVGKVQIDADNLDMHNTRIRGQGDVLIKAKQLISNAGAAIDSPNISFNLQATNNDLRIVNLTPATVGRLTGDLLAWSAVWQNAATVVLTNNYAVTNVMDTNGVIIGTNAVPVPLTNSVTIGLYALILDGNSLAAQLPVFTWDLVLQSTNMLIGDRLSVVQSLILQGTALTINGALNLTTYNPPNQITPPVTVASLSDWVYTNAPDLLYLTNNGSLSMLGQGHFGDDRPLPYVNFVNKGTINVGSLDVNSSYIENDGDIFANVGPLNLVGQIGGFQGGATESSGDLNLTFADMKFLNHILFSVGALNFSATGALSDTGAGSGNTFYTENGFNLLVKPNTGDLLGTTINDEPPAFVEVDHVWAGEDRGATAAGFNNNVAIGKLVLIAQDNSGLRAPFFFFTGTNGQRALYVDLLDLTSLGTNYTSLIGIDPSLTIYYAAAKLGFTPPANSSGISQEPEEFLNGQFGGHLVWVSSFAGPNSSTAVIVNGQTVLMNTALRNSKIIDSDGDGIPNFYDATPLGGSGGPVSQGVTINGNFNAPTSSRQVFTLNFNAAANTAYRIEMTTDLAHPNWQLVTTYTNSSPATANVTISDNNNVIGPQRFYRVRIAQ